MSEYAAKPPVHGPLFDCGDREGQCYTDDPVEESWLTDGNPLDAVPDEVEDE